MSRQFEDDLLKEKLIDAMEMMIEENLGTEMTFSLVAGAQELLNTLFDGIKSEREELKRRKEQEIEEAERKRFEGTRVSSSSVAILAILITFSFRFRSKHS